MKWTPLALALLFACKGPETPHDAGAPPIEKRSESGAREKVGITVYNQNFGLVREVRSIDLGTGKLSLEVADVASTIQPETVAIRAVGSELHVLEQNYRYDLLTPATLLEKFLYTTEPL